VKITINVIGSTYDQFAELDNQISNQNNIDIELSYSKNLPADSNQLSSDVYLNYLPTSVAEAAKRSSLIDEKSIFVITNDTQGSRKLGALGHHILRYPFTAEEFIAKVKAKLLESFHTDDKPVTATLEEKTLVFASTDRYVMVEKDKLVHASSSGNYTTLFLNDEKEVTVTKQLGKVVSKLPRSTFFRTHHGHVINRKYIVSVLKQGQLQVVLRNQSRVPVSRRKRKEFLSWLGLE